MLCYQHALPSSNDSLALLHVVWAGCSSVTRVLDFGYSSAQNMPLSQKGQAFAPGCQKEN